MFYRCIVYFEYSSIRTSEWDYLHNIYECDSYRMANTSDYNSDHGEDFSGKSREEMYAQIERLEKQEVELQRRKNDKADKRMLEQKLKDLKGSINSLKSGKTSPGSSKNKSRHAASSRESEFAGLSGLSELTDNRSSKMRELLQNQLLDRAGPSGFRGLQSESDESDSDGGASRNCEWVFFVCFVLL